MTAHCYDLATELPTFDFYSWLVTVVAKGATEIVIDASNPMKGFYSPALIERRAETIIRPGPGLFGLRCRYGEHGDRSTTCRLEDFIAFAAKNKWPRAKCPHPAGQFRYTVTLRDSPKSPYRNSDDEAWRRFAKEIGAIVIEDYDKQPMHLHNRLALYAGAEMNFGTSGGPMFLLTLTEYPVMIFNFGPRLQMPFLLKKCKLNFGSSLPWALPNHIVHWGPATYDSLMRGFEEWQTSRSAPISGATSTTKAM